MLTRVGVAAVVVLAAAAVADAVDRGARAGAPRDLERSAAPSVRARMCSRPSEWRWSSYPAVLGASPQPSFLTGD